MGAYFEELEVQSNKKYESYRLCKTFGEKNRKIIKDRYTLQMFEKVGHNLQQAKVFITIDLKNGLIHVKLEEIIRKYIA